MTPTEQEYNNAKEIVSAYESEEKRLLDIKLDKFKLDLNLYFENNLLDGYYKVESFRLHPCWTGNPKRFDIYPEPYLDECYGGGNDDDIETLAKKHGVEVSFSSGVYGK